MHLAKVIGNVVSTIKDQGLASITLLVVVDLDDDLNRIGEPYIAADSISSGPGDIVYIVGKKEAARVFDPDPNSLIPIDQCIVGFVDDYNLEIREKKSTHAKTPPKRVKPIKKPKADITTQEERKKAKKTKITKNKDTNDK